MEAPSLGPNLVCLKCGIVGADVRPPGLFRAGLVIDDRYQHRGLHGTGAEPVQTSLAQLTAAGWGADMSIATSAIMGPPPDFEHCAAMSGMPSTSDILLRRGK
jgi:hypothetical protein